MKRMLGLAAALTAALVLTGTASAQGKKGKGFRGGGGFGQLGLLTNADVQKDMKLTEDQITKIKELSVKQKDAFKGFDKLDKEERAAKGKEMREEQQKAIDELLTADQKTRLKQLQLRQSGAFAFFNPQLSEKLELTDDQKGKIKELFGEFGPKFKELFSLGKDDPQAAATKRAELDKELKKEIVKTLTSEQKAKYKEMLGPKFEGKLPSPFGFGMGRRGGGTSQIEALPRQRRLLL